MGRDVFTLIARNGFYTLLENDDVGTIVTKMWMGPKQNYGILGASTIINSFNSAPNSDEAMKFSAKIDTSKPYFFHFE